MTQTDVLLKDSFTGAEPGNIKELKPLREEAYNDFVRMGVPGVKHEEWKYTRISSLFNKPYAVQIPGKVTEEDVKSRFLPGHHEANVISFVNGRYDQSLSHIFSGEVIIQPLDEAAVNENKEIVEKYLGESSKQLYDGVHALNTAFSKDGVFISCEPKKEVAHPVYIYHISDGRAGNIFSQPRSLIYIPQAAHIQLVEIYVTLGEGESFTNGVIEMVADKDAMVEYYKIQNDVPNASQVSTMQIHQIEKCHVHTVIITLDGGIIRNNLNVIMDAANNEAHLYGLYFVGGKTHVDNHTLVDNVQPNCFSNQLYKGIAGGNSTAVFNGKIYVKQAAQKTNAYQSNKNITISPTATINAKPQLEIFADDVKCSHGCTIGQLDEESLFYLRSRGIPEKTARAILIRAYAMDVLEHVKPVALKDYVDKIINEKLKQ